MTVLSSPISGFSEASARGTMRAWVTKDVQNPVLGTLPAGSYVYGAHVHVTVAFNSDANDTLTAGYDADTDAIFTSIDVSTTGVKSVTLGALSGYNATARNLEAYYVNSGTEPTTGKALVIIEFYRVPPSP